MTRGTSLDGDTVLRLLAPRRRREVVRYLRGHRHDAVELSALAAAVVRRCPEEATPTTETDLVTQLHHSDLPALGDAGVLEYDRTERRVVYDGRTDIEALLDTVAEHFG